MLNMTLVASQVENEQAPDLSESVQGTRATAATTSTTARPTTSGTRHALEDGRHEKQNPIHHQESQGHDAHRNQNWARLEEQRHRRHQHQHYHESKPSYASQSNPSNHRVNYHQQTMQSDERQKTGSNVRHPNPVSEHSSQEKRSQKEELGHNFKVDHQGEFHTEAWWHST